MRTGRERMTMVMPLPDPTSNKVKGPLPFGDAVVEDVE
jgi:hypothetical protein